jgi:hypothetical protein
MTNTTIIPSTRWIPRSLPTAHIRPAFSAQAAGSITDTATRKSVDDKLNAALKNELKRSVNLENPVLEKLVDGLKLDYKAERNSTINQLIKEQLVPVLRKNKDLKELSQELEKRGEKAASPSIAELLDLDVPLTEHPLFINDIRQGEGRELLRIAKLNENLIAKLDRHEKVLEAWNNADWERAVKEKTLTPDQKKRFSSLPSLAG